MNPILAVIRSRHGATGESLGRYCHVWCPGCGHGHTFVIVDVDGFVPPGPVWEWDGNLEAPTFSPSLLCRRDYGPKRDPHVCHSFVRNGQWEFLSDSTHRLAGKTVPLPPLPDWLCNSNERNES